MWGRTLFSSPTRFTLGVTTVLPLIPRSWLLNVLRSVQIVLTHCSEAFCEKFDEHASSGRNIISSRP